MKKRMEIEAVLSWCFGQELPKVGRLPEDRLAGTSPGIWAAVQRYALLGTKVDESGAHWGLAPVAPASPEAVHPDALLVNEAVMRIAAGDVAMPEGYDAIGDIDGLTDDERADLNRRGFDIAQAQRDQLHALVVRRALIGTPPAWEDHGPIKRRYVKSGNGRDAWFVKRAVESKTVDGRTVTQEIETNGLHHRTKRLMPGAYRKSYFDPCPSLLAAERIEYQAWAMTLDLIAADLVERLASIEVLPRAAALWPWEGEEARERPRIHFAVPAANATERASSAAA